MLDDGSDPSLVSRRELAVHFKRNRATIQVWTSYASFPWPVGVRKEAKGAPVDVFKLDEVVEWKSKRTNGGPICKRKGEATWLKYL